jgi:hypothetical protein
MIYHVTPKWDGGDLKSLKEQYGDNAYDVFVERWPEAERIAWEHIDYVHCFATREEAEYYLRDWREGVGGQLLEIDDRALETSMDRLERGQTHVVVRGRIPARYIRHASDKAEVE